MITLRKIHHRGSDQIGIFFKYDLQLIEYVKELGACYSKSKKCWYLPYDLPSFNKLQKQFPDGLKYARKSKLPPIKRSTTKAYSKEKKKPIKEFEMTTLWSERIREFKIYLGQRRYAAATIDAYCQSLLLFFEWYCREGEPKLDLLLLNRYNHAAFIEKKRSRSLQNAWVSGMKLFLKKFENLSIDSADLERPKKSLRLPNVLSVEEVRQFIGSFRNTKHRTLFLMVYACGLRRSEVINIKIEHLDFDRNILRIKNSKGAKDRDVPIPNRLKKVLQNYLTRYKPQVFLFNGKADGPYSGSSINKLVKQGARRIELKKSITCHTLRHSYATHLMEKNINLRYIQEALGHKSSKTTEIYTKLSKESIAKLVSPIDFW